MSRLLKFVILDIDGDSEPRDRVEAAILSVPDDIKMPEDADSKNLILKAFYQSYLDRKRWNKKFALSEKDAEFSPSIKAMFEIIDWSQVDPIWIDMPENPIEAFEYVKKVGPSKSVEHLLAADTSTAYRYSMDILENRFPEGEEAIGRDAVRSVNYADMAKCRIVSGESAIAESEDLAFLYGKFMKKHDLWGSWSESDVARSPVWMYQYAKDYVKGRLPDSLHNKMTLMSFSESDSNKWMKKYLGAKKYFLKKKRVDG
jgi:hypothetical protein